MKSFEYVIKDKLGIHARPAGALVKAAKAFDSTVTIDKGGNQVEATKLMAVMRMGITCGDKVTVSVEGSDEEQAFESIKKFFEENL